MSWIRIENSIQVEVMNSAATPSRSISSRRSAGSPLVRITLASSSGSRPLESATESAVSVGSRSAIWMYSMPV